MFNEALFNEAMFNDGGASAPVPPGGIVDTIDPGVSFTVSDELGGFEEAISDECMC
jgi:hypothetical protein